MACWEGKRAGEGCQGSAGAGPGAQGGSTNLVDLSVPLFGDDLLQDLAISLDEPEGGVGAVSQLSHSSQQA